MRGWWRWAVRGLAATVDVVGLVVLNLHPTVVVKLGGSRSVASGTVSKVDVSCYSPLNTIQPHPFYHGPPLKNPLLFPWMVPGCRAATIRREHMVDALGIGVVVLVGLSLLPRRRVLATARLEHSLV